MAKPVATGWEAWLASARQVEHQGAREPQKRRAKALPGPLHLKGETQLESTRPQAGLILDERIARLSRLVTLFLVVGPVRRTSAGGLPTRQLVVVDGSHPPVELATITATPELGSFSPALPFACSERDHIEATLHPKITDNSGHWWRTMPQLSSSLRPGLQVIRLPGAL
jgi:hypothetical protein